MTEPETMYAHMYGAHLSKPASFCRSNDLKAFQQNNAKHKITGIMLVNEDYVVQYVEGPRDHVEALLENITNDSRIVPNTMMDLLGFETQARIFPNWNMQKVNEKQMGIELEKIVEHWFISDGLEMTNALDMKLLNRKINMMPKNLNAFLRQLKGDHVREEIDEAFQEELAQYERDRWYDNAFWVVLGFGMIISVLSS